MIWIRLELFTKGGKGMKVKLHRPRRGLWNAALLLLVIGLLGTYLPIPILSQVAFYFIVASAVLMLLGTWVV
jgi:hypothetical protein